jgi:hypothetical protein
MLKRFVTLIAAMGAVSFASHRTFARENWPIPGPDVKARLETYDQHEKEVIAKIKPVLDEWAKKGKPFIPSASKPEDLPQADIPAFPGAEGGGMHSFGGRGGKVYVVTTLDDSGPGSLREACEAAGPRIVVFNVAGIIHLKMPIFIEAPYITIAGQTAPGDGICIADQGIEDNAHDVVIRYIRLRRGNTDIYNRHGTHYGNPIGNIILDHVSSSWGCDQNMDTYRHMYEPPEGGPAQKLPAVNVTIQWSITSEGLNTWNHAFGGDWGGRNTGFHHNLFACNTGRNPSIAMTYDFNFANNVLFNWRHRTVDGGDEKSTINMINNYFKPGPATPYTAIRYRIVRPDAKRVKNSAPEFGKVYADGNYVDGNETVTRDNWAGGVQIADANGGSEDAPPADDGAAPATGTLEMRKLPPDVAAKMRVDKPFPMPPMTIQSAQDAYQSVLADAGATLPRRDPVDARVIEEVRTGKTWGMGQHIPIPPMEGLAKNNYGVAGNGIITDIAQVGGYPDYKGEPIKYSQNDGIPDWWKKKYGLDVNDPGLAGKDSNGDGYTNIEKYVNGLDPTKKVDWKDPKNNVNTLTPQKLTETAAAGK